MRFKTNTCDILCRFWFLLRHFVLWHFVSVLRHFVSICDILCRCCDILCQNWRFVSILTFCGLTPLLSTVYFVYSAYKLFDKYKLRCCREHLCQILARIDSPMSTNQKARATLSNILLKAFVLDNSDKERHQGCLRRKEKLSSN